MKRVIKSALFNLRFNLSASNNFLFRWNYKYFYRPKKGTLSAFLSDYSKSVGDSFTVVQIGANDGITHDPIHKFIKRDKWGGVLLEPQSYVFDNYLSKIYRKHPNITVLNAAMGMEDGEAILYKIGFSNARWATGLATFDRATLEKAFSSGHVSRKCRKEKINIPEDTATHIAEEKVNIISQKTLRKKYALNKVDLLMIDTEGFDFEIIKMFNIAVTNPGAIVFEHSHLSDEDYAECLGHLETNDYVIRKEGANTVAIKKELNHFPDYFID
ncbi:MAG: FkbM family methyltransferase [Crocinitomicaceae bacterium]